MSLADEQPKQKSNPSKETPHSGAPAQAAPAGSTTQTQGGAAQSGAAAQTGPSGSTPQAQDTTAAQPGAPQGTPAGTAARPGNAPVDPKTFIIGADDILQITVWNEPQLSRTYNVRPDGKISMPLINEINAAGLTPERLGATIAESLSSLMQHPEVSVAVTQVLSRKYFIMGEVQRVGAFPLTVPTTVLEALVNAGGFREFAKTKDIIIMRGTQRLHFNYNNVIKGKDLSKNIKVEPGDQIIVR